MRKTLKVLFRSNYWSFCQCNCSWNMFWKIYSSYIVYRLIVGIFKSICTVAIHCWSMKDAFAGFSQQIFEKK